MSITLVWVVVNEKQLLPRGTTSCDGSISATYHFSLNAVDYYYYLIFFFYQTTFWRTSTPQRAYTTQQISILRLTLMLKKKNLSLTTCFHQTWRKRKDSSTQWKCRGCCCGIWAAKVNCHFPTLTGGAGASPGLSGNAPSCRVRFSWDVCTLIAATSADTAAGCQTHGDSTDSARANF